jgi:predicted house-cleaning NTP pyrophosphatase (Maf/HAM1 superfamily)
MLILGSTSWARKHVLESRHLNFQVYAVSIDEKTVGNRNSDPFQVPVDVASAKLDAVWSKLKTLDCEKQFGSNDLFVIAADQIVLGPSNQIHEKPVDHEEARRFMQSYAGSYARTISALVVLNLRTGAVAKGYDVATVYYDAAYGSEATINAALIPVFPIDIATLPFKTQEHSPLFTNKTLGSSKVDILSCAGAVMIEHPAVTPHIVEVDGSVESVYGLPLDLLRSLLKQVGGDPDQLLKAKDD